MIEDPEPPHAHHGKSGIAWLDLALALAVIGLSIASLVSAQHTGHTMERLVAENSRLVRANATPLLQFGASNINGGKQELTLSVSNVGTGTARVIWFELAKRGVPQPDFIHLLGYQPDFRKADYVASGDVAGTYLPAGEQRVVLSWKVPTIPESMKAWNALDAERSKLVASACFCSVLNDCWISHLQADAPKAVASCDPKGHVNYGAPLYPAAG